MAEFQPPEGLQAKISDDEDVDLGLCVRCFWSPASDICCSAHNKELCHHCYRRTHFVEVCVVGCSECAREGLPVKLSGPPLPVSSTGEEPTGG